MILCSIYQSSSVYEHKPIFGHDRISCRPAICFYILSLLIHVHSRNATNHSKIYSRFCAALDIILLRRAGCDQVYEVDLARHPRTSKRIHKNVELMFGSSEDLHEVCF